MFGEYELLTERRLLRRNGRDVDLAGKAFDALVLLVERSPSLVTKEEMISALWPDTVVAEGSLTSQIWGLRKTLGEGRWVENVPRRGYQFVGEFRLLADEPNGTSSPAAVPVAPPPSPEVLDPPSLWSWRPALAWTLGGLIVLILGGYYLSRGNTARNLSLTTGRTIGDFITTEPLVPEGFPPQEAYVADAVTHSIRYRLEEATRSWPESALGPWRHLRRTGSVRKENGRIVVDIQLVGTGKAIWSDRYSQPYPIAETVIGDVIGEHLARLLEQSERRPSPGPAAFDAVRDFSLKTSPQSAWKYGQVRDWTGIGFRHFTVAGPDHGDCWTAGHSTPEGGVICLSKEPVEGGTIVQSPDALFMTTNSRCTTVRWVAPADGRYSVKGRIRMIDTVGRPCRVKLAHNTLNVLVERRNFASFGSTIPVDIPSLELTQGSALDVIFGPEIGVDYMNIDVQLTVRPIGNL